MTRASTGWRSQKARASSPLATIGSPAPLSEVLRTIGSWPMASSSGSGRSGTGSPAEAGAGASATPSSSSTSCAVSTSLAPWRSKAWQPRAWGEWIELGGEFTNIFPGVYDDGILVAFTDNSLNATYSDLPDNGYIGYLFRHGNSRSGLIRMVNAGAAGSGEWSIVDSGVADQWYVGGLRWSGDTLTSERDRQTVVSAPGQAFSALTHLHISTLASVWNFDWVLVRKGAAVDSIATVVTPLVYTDRKSVV